MDSIRGFLPSTVPSVKCREMAEGVNSVSLPLITDHCKAVPNSNCITVSLSGDEIMYFESFGAEK